MIFFVQFFIKDVTLCMITKSVCLISFADLQSIMHDRTFHTHAETHHAQCSHSWWKQSLSFSLYEYIHFWMKNEKSQTRKNIQLINNICFWWQSRKNLLKQSNLNETWNNNVHTNTPSSNRLDLKKFLFDRYGTNFNFRIFQLSLLLLLLLFYYQYFFCSDQK